ncbi:MAG: HAD family hydrolase [Spirochaetaceae bacterium]
MKIKKYKTYLFDVDGTLLDTNELIYQSFKNSCKFLGNIDISREEVNKHIGIPLKTQLDLYLGESTEEEYANIYKIHSEYQKTIYKDTLKAFPGVIEGLKVLKDRGVQVAIVSSRTRPSLDRYLKFIGIYDLFTVFSTPEVTVNHKPHPDPVLWALEQLGADKEFTIFIGDATFDIESGNAAGVDTAFVDWGHNSLSDIQVKPTYHLKTFSDLLD